MDYKEKLEDPRWKRLRMMVLDEDHHRCRLCGKEDVTLNVHHIQYHYGKEPWEYPMQELVTLCEDCHKIIHERKWNIKLTYNRRIGFESQNYKHIQKGDVLVHEDFNSIFIAADNPIREVINFDEVLSSNCKFGMIDTVDTVVSLHEDGGLGFREMSFPLEKWNTHEARKATEEEKQMLLQAIKDFMN